ncbi:MAG: surface-adhesin E family protein [Betaproteobacteria bacterium]
MHKIILMLLFAGLSNFAIAEWTAVGFNDASTYYIEPAAINKARDKVKMWALFDLKRPSKDDSNKVYLSQKSQYEFDCKERQFRMLYFSFHSENMGKGETNSFDSTPSQWVPVPPDSVIEGLGRVACGKVKLM